VTVNWRDIRATVKQQPAPSKQVADELPNDESDEGGEGDLASPADPVDDPLKWLDDGLPDLSGFENRYFDLAAQFDIARYVQILADGVSDSEPEKATDTHPKPQGSSQKNVQASILVPKDSEWTTW